jgi:hypothetical protein
MSAYATIAPSLARIDDELAAVARREGIPQVVLTGRIEMDHSNERCWFEVLDNEAGITAWVTPDAPGLAAHGETLCAAASLDEAFMLGEPDYGHQRDYPHTH